MAWRLGGLGIVAAGLIFAADLMIPLGVAGGVPYALVLLLFLWIPSLGASLLAAVACTGLTLLGLVLSPLGGPTWQVYVNRGLAIFIIWTTLALVALQRRAQDSGRLHAEILENMSEGVSLARRADRIIVYANPRFEQMFGYSQGELLGEHSNILNVAIMDEVGTIESKISKQIRDHGSWNGDLQTVRKNGTLLWMRAHISAFDHPVYGEVWISILQDVSSEKQAQESLRRAEHLAAVGTLAAGIAHEINNPIGGILMTAEAALRRLRGANTDASIEQYLDKIKAESVRCGRIIKSVLHFAREEVTERWRADLRSVASHVRDHMADYALGEGIDLQLALGEDPAEASINPLEIRQALTNLVSNAIHASDEGSPVCITVYAEHGAAIVAVEDSGIGIANELLVRIFDPFYTTRLRPGSAGLGLSVALAIVERHGGTIEVDSSLSNGTTVAIELPLAREAFEDKSDQDSRRR